MSYYTAIKKKLKIKLYDLSIKKEIKNKNIKIDMYMQEHVLALIIF